MFKDFFIPLKDADKELDINEKALLSFELYPWGKIKPFAEAIVKQEKLVKEIIAFGVPEKCWKEATEYLKENSEIIVEGQLKTSGLSKTSRKPYIFSTTKTGGESGIVIRTPLGHGHTRLYWDCLKFFKDEKNVELLKRSIKDSKSLTENVKEVDVQLLKEFHDLMKNITLQDVFTATFCTAPENQDAFKKNYDAFQAAYFFEKQEHDDLREALQNSIVFVGTTLDKNSFEVEFNSIKLVKEYLSHHSWKARVYENLSTRQNFCVFEWTDSFLGETSEMVGYTLLDHGAKELIHFGCKVGTYVDPKVVGHVFIPRSFSILVHGSNRPTEIIQVKNSRFENTEALKSGEHISIPNPIYETFENILDQKKLGITTVDDEGGFFARAVARYNQEHVIDPAFFGAVYWTSDVVLTETVATWYKAVAEKDGITDTLNISSNDSKKRPNDTLNAVLSKILSVPVPIRQVKRFGTFNDRLSLIDDVKSHKNFDKLLFEKLYESKDRHQKLNHVVLCASDLDMPIANSMIKTFILRQNDFQEIWTVDYKELEASIKQLLQQVDPEYLTHDDVNSLKKLLLEKLVGQTSKTCLIITNVRNFKELNTVVSEWMSAIKINPLVKVIIVTNAIKNDSSSVINISDSRLLSEFFNKKLKDKRDKIKEEQLNLLSNYQLGMTTTIVLSSIFLTNPVFQIVLVLGLNWIGAKNVFQEKFENKIVERQILTDATNVASELKALLELKNIYVDIYGEEKQNEQFQEYNKYISDLLDNIFERIQERLSAEFIEGAKWRANQLSGIQEQEKKRKKVQENELYQLLKTKLDAKPKDKIDTPFWIYPFHSKLVGEEIEGSYFETQAKKYQYLTLDLFAQSILTGGLAAVLHRIWTSTYKGKAVVSRTRSLVLASIIATCSSGWLIFYHLARYKIYSRGQKEWMNLREKVNSMVAPHNINFQTYREIMRGNFQKIYNDTNTEWAKIHYAEKNDKSKIFMEMVQNFTSRQRQQTSTES